MNTVALMGFITAEPRRLGSAVTLGIGILEERHGRQRLQHVHVVARGRLAQIANDLHPAQDLYVGGHLTGRGGLGLVEATTLFALSDPQPASGAHTAGGGTHRSPRPHDRVGHLRRLRAGRADERVTWVRPARVGGA